MFDHVPILFYLAVWPVHKGSHVRPKTLKDIRPTAFVLKEKKSPQLGKTCFLIHHNKWRTLLMPVKVTFLKISLISNVITKDK